MSARIFQILKFRKVKLDDANPRSELNGKEHIPAVDLKFSAAFTNDILSVFHPDLLDSFYKANDEAQAEELPPQGAIDGLEALSSKPVLRFPKMVMPFKWELEGTGYSLTVDHGMGGKSNIVLGGCKINEFKLALQEGGTVILSWRMQASKVDDSVLGKLCALIQQQIEVMVEGPQDDGQGKLDDGDEGSAPAAGPAAAPASGDPGREATDAFIGQHGSATH